MLAGTAKEKFMRASFKRRYIRHGRPSGNLSCMKSLDRRLQQVKEKNSLGMRCSGTHNNPDKPLETKSCGPNRSSRYPTARLHIFDPLTIPPQGFGLPKTRLLE